MMLSASTGKSIAISGTGINLVMQFTNMTALCNRAYAHEQIALQCQLQASIRHTTDATVSLLYSVAVKPYVHIVPLHIMYTAVCRIMRLFLRTL
jgi:hypothetical protein